MLIIRNSPSQTHRFYYPGKKVIRPNALHVRRDRATCGGVVEKKLTHALKPRRYS